MKHYLLLALAALCFFTLANADQTGLITKKSAHPPKETIDRLETQLTQKGITVALRWSHSDRARDVGIDVRPTELIVFGNPKLGSHMFTSNQAAGIDFPMKVLAWEDENGQAWVTYNDPTYLAERHGIQDRAEIVQKMTGALQTFTDAAAAP
jgi:uncharacterized protein (DUF302 family)